MCVEWSRTKTAHTDQHTVKGQEEKVNTLMSLKGSSRGSRANSQKGQMGKNQEGYDQKKDQDQSQDQAKGINPNQLKGSKE